MSKPTNAAIKRHGQPLCCRYSLVHIETLPIDQQQAAGAVSNRTLHWAFGVLASRE